MIFSLFLAGNDRIPAGYNFESILSLATQVPEKNGYLLNRQMFTYLREKRDTAADCRIARIKNLSPQAAVTTDFLQPES
jgi:hypothetical protein